MRTAVRRTAIFLVNCTTTDLRKLYNTQADKNTPSQAESVFSIDIGKRSREGYRFIDQDYRFAEHEYK